MRMMPFVTQNRRQLIQTKFCQQTRREPNARPNPASAKGKWTRIGDYSQSPSQPEPLAQGLQL
jgi:hypothetical protein